MPPQREIDGAFIAQADQLLAAAKSKLDELIALYHSECSERGETKAMCNIALLVTLLPEGLKNDLLIAALVRLGAGGRL